MNKPLTLIAGGIGVTPLLSMLRSASSKDLKLFYSVSSDEDILFLEELAPYSVFTVTKAIKNQFSFIKKIFYEF